MSHSTASPGSAKALAGKPIVMSRTDPADGSSPSSWTPRESPGQDTGRVYQSRRTPGLTPAGVAVIGTAVTLVAGVVSALVTDGLGWLFSVPFILVSAYCATEVQRGHFRSALVMPPLALLLVALIVPWINGEADGLRGWALRTLTELAKAAPALTAALIVSGAILAWRRWGPKRA
ncbi:MAG TPA: DUF6542 domain-containing protein [Actinomycetes bacterium]|nr:DUF6542 domain-containing protein [Actinomycetes bacterium]